MANAFTNLLLGLILVVLTLSFVNSVWFGSSQANSVGVTGTALNDLNNIKSSATGLNSYKTNLLTSKVFNGNSIAKQATQQNISNYTRNIASQQSTLIGLNGKENSLIAGQSATSSNINSMLKGARTQLGAIEANPRTTIFNLESDVPLNHYRNDWSTSGSASIGWTGNEYFLNGSGSNSNAVLSTAQYGAYSPGYVGQIGVGTRIPKKPTGNSNMKWGYYNSKNGFYFGVNSTCTFVALKRAGTVQRKVCQNNWNVNTLNTTKQTKSNPSGYKLSLAEGNIYQFEYTWYGYGQITAEVVIDRPNMKEKVVPVQRFDPKNTSSINRVNLPINTTLHESNSNNIKMFVGGRQYSIEGKNPIQSREDSNYVGSTSINSTAWTPVMSFRGKPSLKYIRLNVLGFDAITNCETRYQLRRDTKPNNPNWKVPSSTNKNETAVQVDTQSTSVSRNGKLTGYKFTGGLLAGSSSHSKSNVGGQANINGVVGAGEPTTLLMRSVSTGCSVDATIMRWREDW